ncbi:MAG: NAD-dependent epimerase/dehydratase family protein [Bacteroidetes bacterium]|nr:NAD-dependent epimerase/dehydratase family protein [Bacteroidota bacterium]
MAKVLVTGASGFVGNNLTRHLLTLGHQVNLLLRDSYADWRITDIRDDVEIHTADLLDSDAVNRIVKEIGPDWVFHLAAHGAYSSQTDVMRILESNVIGTATLVQACLNVGFDAFVNTGSSSEYGFKDHSPDEQEWLEPNSYYAVAKASATLFCRYTAQTSGLRISTLRLYSVYGPYEEPTRLMPTLIVKGLKKELPPLVAPHIARDYVYVDDVVRAYILAATKENQVPGAVYNVGTGVQTSLREVVDVACRTLAIDEEPKWGSMENRIWDTGTWVSDSRCIKQALGWHPEYTFEQGFGKMVKWFEDRPAMIKEYRQSIGATD